MAVRSALMEHFKSTLATTAVLLAGLVTAAQILHPRDPAYESRRTRQVSAPTAVAWSDPPARVAPAVADVVRPASFTMMPEAMIGDLSGAEATFHPPVQRRAEGAPRQRMAQGRARAALVRRDARADLPAAQAQAVAAQPAEAGSKAGSDPIGDLLRNLGLGGDKEG